MEGPTDDTGERQKLATRRTMAGVIGVTVLSRTVIALSDDRRDVTSRRSPENISARSR